MSNFLWTPKQARLEEPSAVGLVQLALPLLGESILRCTVGLVNVVFLNRISGSAVSAVSVSNQYITICQTLATAVATGTIVYINQAIGMKNRAKVDRLATIAFTANLGLGLLFGTLFFFLSGNFLSIMKLAAVSISSAETYLRITGSMITVQCVEIVFSNICRSIGHTKAPLGINLLVNTVNLLGCYIVIFHPLLFCVDPVTGVAIVSVLSRLCGMILAGFIVVRSDVHISLRNLKPFPKAELRLSLSVGIPGGFNNLAYSLSQLVTTSIISMAGESMVAAKIYVNNLVQYIALVGMAFAQASTIMVGYRVGAGNYDEAREIRVLVTRIALISNACFSFILILLRKPLLRAFTREETILQIGSALILIDFIVEIGRALNNTLSGALQAAGDVKFQLAVNQASGWMIAVGGAYLLGITLGWGLYGVWIAFALDEMTRGLILLIRWRSNGWIAGAERRRTVLSDGAQVKTLLK